MKTYGLLGKNINYSSSPCMHNAAFKELGIQAKYEIFDREENELDDFFAKLASGEISGCNVTIPYKEIALGRIDEYDNVVASIGALNTIVSKNNKLEGHNTDFAGFLNTLTGSGKWDLGFDFTGKNVFVFGAGGAARTAIFSMLRNSNGAKKIIITDVDNERAQKLADSFVEKQVGNTLISVVQDKGQYDEFISKSDLLINATPCGMKESDPNLFDYRYIHEGLFVFDLIYAVETPLFKEASRRARKVINGLGMLLGQATEAFQYWTEIDPPVEVMERALLERMGR